MNRRASFWMVVAAAAVMAARARHAAWRRSTASQHRRRKRHARLMRERLCRRVAALFSASARRSARAMCRAWTTTPRAQSARPTSTAKVGSNRAGGRTLRSVQLTETGAPGKISVLVRWPRHRCWGTLARAKACAKGSIACLLAPMRPSKAQCATGGPMRVSTGPEIARSSVSMGPISIGCGPYRSSCGAEERVKQT